VNDESDDSAKTALRSADPPRNFSLSVGERIRALTIGAPAYSTRKKYAEDLEERFLRILVKLHDTLVARGEDDDAVSRALAEKAATFDLTKLNALIATHNRWYPIEANLPFDPRTGEYLVYGRPWCPDERWSAARMVERAQAMVAARSDAQR
jgi:hypothetical protein